MPFMAFSVESVCTDFKGCLKIVISDIGQKFYLNKRLLLPILVRSFLNKRLLLTLHPAPLSGGNRLNDIFQILTIQLCKNNKTIQNL